MAIAAHEGWVPITNQRKIKFHGYFDVQKTYKEINSYLSNKVHYSVSEVDLDRGTKEGKKSITSRVDAHRAHDDYYKVRIRYVLEMEGSDKTITVDGKEKKLTKGDATIWINTYIEQDWRKERDSGIFPTFIAKLYEKLVGNKDIFDPIIGSIKDVNGLIEVFKKNMVKE